MRLFNLPMENDELLAKQHILGDQISFASG